jgi:hypothetical protein
MDEAFSSGSNESRAEPHFQQDDEAFAIGNSGSSAKQTAHLSNRGTRCRAQWVWNTNAHSLRIQTVRVPEIISWRHKGQNAYLVLPWGNRSREPRSQFTGRKIHSDGSIGNCCASSCAFTLSSGTLKNFAKAVRAAGDNWSSIKARSSLRTEGPLNRYTASREFLQFLHSANPSLTGWPIWLVSQYFSDGKVQPYTYQDTWEQFIQAPGFSGHHLDFMIFNPKGDFYFARALEDDTHKKKAAPEAPKTVEPIIQLLRVAETLAVVSP